MIVFLAKNSFACNNTIYLVLLNITHLFINHSISFKISNKKRLVQKEPVQNPTHSPTFICSCLFLKRCTTYYIKIIMSKIFLAGLQVLLSSACIAELSWECGWVLHHVFGVQISPY